MRIALAVAIASGVVALGCDGRSDETAMAPTSTFAPFETAVSPPAIPTPTIPPFPTIGPAVVTWGCFVFHRGADLWVAQLDGSQEFALVEGALGSHFAGIAEPPEGGKVLYYAALTSLVGQEPAIESGTVEVRRRPLAARASDGLVVSMTISGKQVQEFRFRESDVSVSPDGGHLAYADETGLWLRDLATGETRRLLTNTGCDNQDIGLCRAYRSPSWSSSGEWLVLTRILYEGAVADFIRPLEPVTEYTSDIGALWRKWSGDGAYVCGPEGRVGPSGWGVVKPGEPIIGADGATTLAGKFRDLDEELDNAGVRQAERPITDCAWTSDGRVALQYFADERGYDQRIAVLAPDGTLEAEVDHPLFQSGIAGWLPDDSGFILNYGDGEGRPMSFIVLLDGSVHALAVETDDVVAVLPE